MVLLRSFTITREPTPLALGFGTHQILLIIAISDLRVHFLAGAYIYLAISLSDGEFKEEAKVCWSSV
jgi:small-conductance mechanosensitive channel